MSAAKRCERDCLFAGSNGNRRCRFYTAALGLVALVKWTNGGDCSNSLYVYELCWTDIHYRFHSSVPQRVRAQEDRQVQPKSGRRSERKADKACVASKE